MNYAEKAKAFREATSLAFSSAAESGVLPDRDIASHPDMLRPWKSGVNYAAGDIRSDVGLAFRCRQSHTARETDQPHLVPALWARIEKEGEGTHDNPIQYDASIGMELHSGLYYMEDSTLYECFRDTGIPVYNRLADLVNLYVMVSN